MLFAFFEFDFYFLKKKRKVRYIPTILAFQSLNQTLFCLLTLWSVLVNWRKQKFATRFFQVKQHGVQVKLRVRKNYM